MHPIGSSNRILRKTPEFGRMRLVLASAIGYRMVSQRAATMKKHSTEINVRYGETDKMGGAHHSAYLLWFELGRTGLLRDVGYAYRDLEAGGHMLPVMEYNCRFFRGAEYDDIVRIETHVVELRSRTVTFAYRALRGEQLLAEGWTRHLCVDGENKPRRIPNEVIDAMGPFAAKARG